MEYIYATLLLHKAGQEINEANVKKVIESAGLTADDGQIKALMASLDGVDIEEAISQAAAVPVAAAPAASAGDASEAKPAEKKDEKKEEKKEEETAAGLGALFG
jgi:large subunit ribosomal protein L12